MSKIIKNWKELAEVPPNDKYKLEIDIQSCNGWIVPIVETKETMDDYFTYHRYLGTHSFYGRSGTPNVLKEFGWDLELDNWDKEEK